MFTYFLSCLVDSIYKRTIIQATFVIVNAKSMLIEIPFNLTNWMFGLHNSVSPKQDQDKSIPVIRVESPRLTTSYYKEYLGFKVVVKYPVLSKNEFLVQKNNNLIWIKPIGNSNISPIKKLTIYTRNIDKEYNKLFSKVRILTPNNKNLTNSFSIIDCNGMEIEFTRS
jgi:hypothetical protein